MVSLHPCLAIHLCILEFQAGSWSVNAALNSVSAPQPGISTWPHDGYTHPPHANTLPSTVAPAIDASSQAVPSTSVSPATPSTAHPQNAAHSPYHADTLRPVSQGGPHSMWAQQQQPNGFAAPGPGEAYTPLQQLATNTYPNQYSSTSPADFSQARPVGEAASYFQDHPSLTGSSSPAPTATTAYPASSTQWPQNAHPVPHHANSWGPGSQYPNYYQLSHPTGYPGQSLGPPLPSTISPPGPSQPAPPTAPHAPHHAYTIGPGATPGSPQPQQTWNTAYSSPAQTPTTGSYSAQQQYPANAPPLPQRPVGGIAPPIRYENRSYGSIGNREA